MSAYFGEEEWSSLLKGVMLELHEAHPGIARMKSLARQYVWWLCIDADLEQKVKMCKACQSASKPWEWPRRPWSRVHADYAGPFMRQMFLLLVDAHNKWMDIHIVSAATSQSTIEKIRKTFATLGLPEMLVTDNASVFMSSEFTNFVKHNSIRHVTSSPYHPSSNGLAERAVHRQSREFHSLSCCLADLFIHNWISYSQTLMQGCKVVKGNKSLTMIATPGVESLSVVT